MIIKVKHVTIGASDEEMDFKGGILINLFCWHSPIELIAFSLDLHPETPTESL